AALGVPNLVVVHGAAPAALAGLNPPDTIFVGGGLADPTLLPSLWQALKPGGRIVANVISIEGERALLDWQAEHGGALIRLAGSRAERLGAHIGWGGRGPVPPPFL